MRPCRGACGHDLEPVPEDLDGVRPEIDAPTLQHWGAPAVCQAIHSAPVRVDRVVSSRVSGIGSPDTWPDHFLPFTAW